MRITAAAEGTYCAQIEALRDHSGCVPTFLRLVTLRVLIYFFTSYQSCKGERSSTGFLFPPVLVTLAWVFYFFSYSSELQSDGSGNNTVNDFLK